MTTQVTFFFDFISPASYLAWMRMPELISETGAQIDPVPVFLPGIFKATGNVSPIMTEPKRRWLFKDLERCAADHAIPFRANPSFPFSTAALLRGAVAAKARGELFEYGQAVFLAIWRDGLAMNDLEVATAAMTAAGLDGRQYSADFDDAQYKEQLTVNTDDAVAKGAFGAPTFIADSELFFGQDRLDHLKQHLGNLR